MYLFQKDVVRFATLLKMLTVKLCISELMMGIFDQPHIHIKDRENVERILSNMVKDGPSKLQVYNVLVNFQCQSRSVDTCQS